MKVKIELELPEVDVLFKAMNVVDPMNIFLGQLKNKIAQAAKPALQEKDQDEESDNNTASN